MLPSRPRRRVDCAPTPAEHARTFLAAATGLFVGDPGEVVEVARHAMTTEGDLLLAAAPLRDVVGLRVHDGPVPVRVGVVDVAPMPLADRVRGRVAVVGEARVVCGQVPDDVLEHLLVEDGEVLRVVPLRVTVSGRLVGPSRRGLEVDLEDYRTASPDPLVGIESDWLDHLAGDHADVLDALAASVTSGRFRSGRASSVRAVALDRHGLVLRVGAIDVRLAFRAPVACGCDLTDAFADLVDRLAPEVGWGCTG